MAKTSSTSTQKTCVDLNSSTQLLVGGFMYYQLTEDEGRTDDYYKVPATITKVESGERGGEFDSQRVVDLAIGRSIEHGGSFDKANVPYDNSRQPGTCDRLQDGDFVD